MFEVTSPDKAEIIISIVPDAPSRNGCRYRAMFSYPHASDCSGGQIPSNQAFKFLSNLIHNPYRSSRQDLFDGKMWLLPFWFQVIRDILHLHERHYVTLSDISGPIPFSISSYLGICLATIAHQNIWCGQMRCNTSKYCIFKLRLCRCSAVLLPRFWRRKPDQTQHRYDVAACPWRYWRWTSMFRLQFRVYDKH